MKKSTVSDIRKRRIGRPPVYALPVMVRIPPAEIGPLDKWRVKQNDQPSRPEAIRRLVKLGLSKSETSTRPKVLSTAKQNAARAAKLAAKTIDKHFDDQAASEEERRVRKRKLVEGPRMARESRKDRPDK